MRGMTSGVAARVFQERFLLRVDTGQQVVINRRKCFNRLDRHAIPYIGWGGGEVGRTDGRRRDPLKRFGNTAQEIVVHGLGLAPPPSPGKRSSSCHSAVVMAFYSPTVELIPLGP